MNQGDNNVSLARVLDLLCFLVHLQRRILDVQTLYVGRVGLGNREVRGGAHKSDLDAVALHDGVRLHLTGAVLLENVGAQLLVVGTRNDALDQVLVALIKLMVANCNAVGAKRVDKLHRVLVIRNRGDERGAALVVTRVGHDRVRVLGADVVDDARDVGGTHLPVASIRFQAAVEVGDVGNADLDLISLSGACERRDGDDKCGGCGGSDQLAGTTKGKHA